VKALWQKFVISAVTVMLMSVLMPANALDANAQSNNGKKKNGQGRSIDEVARMIRENKQWQILEASPRQDGSMTRYRFKLINSAGKVKIISIDPKKPNLRRLEK
jgi:hypothetical protein